MDYSFLRFLDNLDDASDLGNSLSSEFNYDDQIHLKPGEDYSVITNTPNGISFNSNYRAYLVDCENTVLQDITANVFINEFVHNVTGLKQLGLELINITSDYLTEILHIRLDHTILGGSSYWSNPFILTDYEIEQTKRFDFKHNTNLDGTGYEVIDIKQSIRLKCLKEKNTFVSSMQSYTTFKGKKLSSRVIKTKLQTYMMDMNNDFIYDRMQYLLCHDIIYIDRVRVTDKQTFENDDKYSGTTNVSQNKFKLAIDETDILTHNYVIYSELSVINKIPVGTQSMVSYNTATLGGNYLIINFDRVITLLPGLEANIYKNGALFGTYDSSCFYDSINDLFIDISSNPITVNDVYSVTVNANRVTDGVSLWSGFNIGDWVFEIKTGDWLNTDWNPADWLTN